ncbi:DUF5082 domain-containing protein [Bacillus licheniformis]|nr:DUF5082 domain-containing protein [Bacillus licheniformis]
MIWEKQFYTGCKVHFSSKTTARTTENCQTELEADKRNLTIQRQHQKPELSPTTWQGSLADSLKRQKRYETAYNDICGKQLNEVFKQLKEKSLL